MTTKKYRRGRRRGGRPSIRRTTRSHTSLVQKFKQKFSISDEDSIVLHNAIRQRPINFRRIDEIAQRYGIQPDDIRKLYSQI